MRADRLLALLMLLQSRGRLKARQLARELEVSERTIYRDIDALAAAGVPIYGQPGRDGGYALLDSYRTNLTGLTEGEVRALFMLSIPAPLTELGLSQELRAALLKLSAALPPGRRGDEARVRRRFHLDATWWRQAGEPVPHLGLIHQAVWQDRKLYITYHPPYANQIRRCVAPYGLVAKAGLWHLVYALKGRLRVFPITDLVDVQLSDEPFARPPDFDLAAFWAGWCADYEASLAAFSVRVRVAPAFLPFLPRHFGSQIHAAIAQAGPPDAAGRIELSLSFPSFEAARQRILGFGRGVEVLSPRPLRRSILDFAQQIVDLYRD